MAIKVQFPDGVSTVAAKGLFQWDYGQALEIECAEIGSEVLEVHFACLNMTEAIVRVCTFSNGVGTVTIPDECLEQTSQITVWLYEVDGTQGHTIKTITISVTARTRPGKSRNIPEDYVDQYGQLIEEINEAIDAIENGSITAAFADIANKADYATTAESATSATYATTAGNVSSADKASSADYATSAGKASTATYASSAGSATNADKASSATYATSAGSASSINVQNPISVQITSGRGSYPSLKNNKIYLVVFDEGGAVSSGICTYFTGNSVQLFRVGNYDMKLIDEVSDYVSVVGGTPTGTLSFYQIGGLS